jgi:hypothetical protein
VSVLSPGASKYTEIEVAEFSEITSSAHENVAQNKTHENIIQMFAEEKNINP